MQCNAKRSVWDLTLLNQEHCFSYSVKIGTLKPVKVVPKDLCHNVKCSSQRKDALYLRIVALVVTLQS